MNFAEDFFTLGFDSTLLQLWFNQDKSYGENGERQISSDTQFDEANLPVTIWLEAIAGGFSNVSLLWYESPLSTTGIQFDYVSVITAKPDLKTDSNNNGTIEAADDSIENDAGKERGKVRVNTDDDNQNDVTDKDETDVVKDPGNPDSKDENDLKLLKIEWSNLVGLNNYEMSLEWASTSVKVWDDATKSGNEINAGARWDLGQRDLYVEGISANQNQPIEVAFTLKVWGANGAEIKNLSDELIITVIPERIIWLTGYWDPANTQGILADFATQKENFEKSGLTVKAFDFPVNYQQMSKQFWETAEIDRPIAILSFGLNPNSADGWRLENVARNLPVDQWGQGSFDSQGNWDPVNGHPTGLPIEGGVAGDHSPYGNLGLSSGNGILSLGTFSGADANRTAGAYIGVSGTSQNGSGAKFDITVDGNGAITKVEVHQDNSVYRRGGGYQVNEIITISEASLGGGGAVDFTMWVTQATALPIDPTLAPGAVRNSTLPKPEIVNAINSGSTTQQLNASISNGPTCGEFLCEYMAYHDAWYVAWSQQNSDLDIHQKAEVGGFTHVGSNVMALGGKDAVKLQLQEVIKKLELIY